MPSYMLQLLHKPNSVLDVMNLWMYELWHFVNLYTALICSVLEYGSITRAPHYIANGSKSIEKVAIERRATKLIHGLHNTPYAYHG